MHTYFNSTTVTLKRGRYLGAMQHTWALHVFDERLASLTDKRLYGKIQNPFLRLNDLNLYFYITSSHPRLYLRIITQGNGKICIYFDPTP